MDEDAGAAGAYTAPAASMDTALAPAPAALPVLPIYRDSRLGPLRKTTVDLIFTYKYINKVYYEKKAKAKRSANTEPVNNGWDDANYDYKIQVGEKLDNRYLVQEAIGKGSFGQVVKCLDVMEDAHVAVKIIKSKRPFTIQVRSFAG
jgi:dual specificity tyrosine-phosphorylation-regulated kinase 1